MASTLVCVVLFRFVLPLVLLAACIFRYNGFSLTYLCCLLAIPLLPSPSRKYCGGGGCTGNFQKAVLGISSFACISHIVFQIVLVSLPPYGHYFPNCSLYGQLAREIGLNRFDDVPAQDIFRLVVPDVTVFAISLACVLSCRSLASLPASRLLDSPQQILQFSSDNTTWENTLPYCITVMLLIAGIMLPSVLSVVYFLIFLILGTMWAFHHSDKVRHVRGYVYVRIALIIYSGAHFLLLYLCQFQFFQQILPPENLISRLLGLIGFVYTSCLEEQVLHVHSNLSWPQLCSPAAVLTLYWLLATETRHIIMKKFDDLEKGQSHPWWDPRSWSRRNSRGEKQSLMPKESSQVRGYQSVNNIVQSHDGDVVEQPAPITMPDEVEVNVQGTLGSITMFVMRQSYIAALIIMMAWSITYHSWLSFILLLWACIIWITPFARWFCMVSSPGLVFYAMGLLLLEYIYGLSLTDSELPVQNESNTLDYRELGLQKWEFPCLHLGAQTLFTWVFWITLRQHIREKNLKKLHKTEDYPLSTFARPIVQALKKMSSVDESQRTDDVDGAQLDTAQPSEDAQALMTWLKGGLTKYWILVCCGAFLLVSLQNEVAVYQIGYMAMFLFLLISYQISITTWRLILRPLWWAMVIYSICILLLVYTYQFDNMPIYWHNATMLSNHWLYDLGLRQHTKASLLLELLTPTAFSIIIVIQLHFFHRPFMTMIDFHNARREGEARIEGLLKDSPIEENITATDGARHSTGEILPRIDEEGSASAPTSPVKENKPLIVRIASWYNIGSTLIWRLLELHMLKIVNFTLICVCVSQVCAVNAVIIVLLAIAMPSRIVQRALSYCFMIWSALVILTKMVYQLSFVPEDVFMHNCSDKNLPPPLESTHYVNNAQWVGFYKTLNVSDDINGYLLIVIVVVLHGVVKHHQKLNHLRTGKDEPEQGVLFSEIHRLKADEDLPNCIKYLCNKFYFHFGWEVCMVMIVANMGMRCDVTSVIYGLWLGVFLLLGRNRSSVVWPMYVGFMAVMLPLQYLLVLGWPPGLCAAYPWTSVLNHNLTHWLYLTDVTHPQNAMLLLADFFQLQFACAQEHAYSVERMSRGMGGRPIHMAQGKSDKRTSKYRNPVPNFMINKTWLDFIKILVFQHMYWITLSIVYITVQSTISIFNFGFILACFFFLWHGQSLYLYPRKKVMRWWRLFLCYNFWVLLAKVCLQLVSCVWVEDVMRMTGCYLLQLLSLYCLRQVGYRYPVGSTQGGAECVPADDSGLAMDCACFTFLLIQYRIFSSHYFRHVVREHREQSDMASRGAELVDEHVKKTLDAIRKEDHIKMGKIRKSVLRLKDMKASRHPDEREPQSHYEAIYSGEYMLFDSESEHEMEPDSRSASPSESPFQSPTTQLKRRKKGSLPESPKSGRITPSSVRSSSPVKTATEDDDRSTDVAGPSHIDDDDDSHFVSAIDLEHPSSDLPPQGPPSVLDRMKDFGKVLTKYFIYVIDKVIEILNDISRDYREVTEELRKEMKEKRREKYRLDRARFSGGTRFYQPERPIVIEVDTRSTGPVEDDSDSWSIVSVDDDSDGHDWKNSNLRSTRLLISFYYALLAHTDLLCYLFMVINHINYASILSMPLPFFVFLWGMMSIPRPTKKFWITVITYTQVVIVIKYVFKFQFFRFNSCDYFPLEVKNSPLCFPRIVGIERDSHNSALDLLLLLALFFHRFALKSHGLWRDKAFDPDADEADQDFPPPTTPTLRGRPGSLSYDDPYSFSDVETASNHSSGKVTSFSSSLSRLYSNMKAFYQRMIDPEVGAGAVDVYALMFGCQFIVFLIVMFSWSAFSSPETTTDSKFNLSQIIEQNVVPATFLYMLLTQFILMIVDRYLYLRKYVLAKLVYLVALCFLFHIFMFFVVPSVTKRPFNENVPAIFVYLFKSLYFGLSAYQVRCGYPTRILGNFLTKNYTLISCYLFQGFQAIPFLLELRSILDWVCTDTTLGLFHWLKMEDIYANIYVLKCYRESEKSPRFYQARAEEYSVYSKWGLGGLLVLLLVLIIWFPLLLMSYINSVYTTSLPTDATFTLTIGGYQPLYLYRVSSQSQFMQELTDADLDKIKTWSGRGDGSSEQEEVDMFIKQYIGKNTVVRIKVTGNSSAIWTISPPSRKFLVRDLASDVNNITMTFRWDFTREQKTALVQETISGVNVIPLLPGSNVRKRLALMLNETIYELNNTVRSQEIMIKQLFPSFIRVPASGTATAVDVLYNGSYVDCGIRLRRGGAIGGPGSVEWWEVTQRSPRPIFDSDDSDLEFIVFNDLVPPLHFSFFATKGILGLYVGFVWLIGKFVRLFFTSISYRIMFDEMPNVGRVLKLCLDIYMVRESKEFELEEDLFAKLMYLYRSPQTLIAWTKYKQS